MSIPAALLLLVLLAALIYVLTVRLTVRGVISDAVTGAPLSGVVVSAGEISVQSDAQGRYVLGDLSRAPNLALTLDGYQPAALAVPNPSLLDRETTLDATLQPVVLDGIVTDAATAKPLAGATVAVGSDKQVSAADGTFHFVRVKRDAAIEVSADGYDVRALDLWR